MPEHRPEQPERPENPTETPTKRSRTLNWFRAHREQIGVGVAGVALATSASVGISEIVKADQAEKSEKERNHVPTELVVKPSAVQTEFDSHVKLLKDKLFGAQTAGGQELEAALSKKDPADIANIFQETITRDETGKITTTHAHIDIEDDQGLLGGEITVTRTFTDRSGTSYTTDRLMPHRSST